MSEDSPSSGQRSWLDKLAHAFAQEPKNRQDLFQLLREANRNKLMDDDALAIVEGAIEISELKVRDIMIPRSQMVSIQVDQTPEQFLPAIIEAAHSRYPVFGENNDEILGILLAKDLLPLILNRPADFNLRQILRPCNFVPESKRLNVLLKEFRANHNHMAVVIDEYGGVDGLVTIEDVLEQIVGDIEDEHDVEDDTLIRSVPSGDHIVKALTPVEDFNEFFKSNFSEDEYDTIGGVVLSAFGHLPKRNEVIEIDNWRFRVANSDSRRLHLLRVSKVG